MLSFKYTNYIKQQLFFIINKKKGVNFLTPFLFKMNLVIDSIIGEVPWIQQSMDHFLLLTLFLISARKTL